MARRKTSRKKVSSQLPLNFDSSLKKTVKVFENTGKIVWLKNPRSDKNENGKKSALGRILSRARELNW